MTQASSLEFMLLENHTGQKFKKHTHTKKTTKSLITQKEMFKQL